MLQSQVTKRNPMFIFLSKLLPLFVYPLGLACLLLLVAILFWRQRRFSRRLTIVALVILWLGSTSGTANALARSLERRYLPPEEVPQAEVIVVLGGGTEAADSPRPTVEVNSAGDRVLYAAHLYRQGAAPHLLLTGGEIDWQSGGGSSPADQMAAILIEIGIPQEALWLETESQNTYENALNSRAILEEKGINRILLVTSAMHLPRAVAVFEKQGFEVVPLPVDFTITDSVSGAGRGASLQSRVMAILPSAGNLSLTTNALKEYLGFLVYKLQGWL